jgi:polysaccharide pyruvyl transferase WcaK-like protein
MRIAFFGNFGTGNIGNECTLQAMIHNVRQLLPAAELSCICTEPATTAAEHALRSFPIDPAHGRRHPARVTGRLRLLRLIARPVQEARAFLKACRIMRRTDLIVMTGTGMLSDTGQGPLGLTYQILKWTLAAASCRTRVAFVSVGAEGLAHPFSRFSVRNALRLASYRSYRDIHSREIVARIGFASPRDRVYPDLAFSLPPPAAGGQSPPDAQRPRIAIGLFDYKGAPDPWTNPGYRSYLDKLRGFIVWARKLGYPVRIVIGDLTYDLAVREHLLSRLEELGVGPEVTSEPARSVEELMAQLAGVDLVVATRFHNVLLSLMLGKPVVSVSYEAKNDSLMADMGLSEYCQQIDEFDGERLIEQVLAAQRDAGSIVSSVRERAGFYREQLAEQYRHVLGIV